MHPSQQQWEMKVYKGVNPKIGVLKPPKMDGENHGSKPYEQMEWFGGFGAHPYFWVDTHIGSPTTNILIWVTGILEWHPPDQLQTPWVALTKSSICSNLAFISSCMSLERNCTKTCQYPSSSSSSSSSTTTTTTNHRILINILLKQIDTIWILLALWLMWLMVIVGPTKANWWLSSNFYRQKTGQNFHI